MQQTRRGRRRQSAARTYLRPALKRPNLQVVTDALVHRVVFDGKRATGVEFSRGGAVERADAAREVILSGGAIGSPHVLQLSGVGDPEHLGRIGVPVRARAAGGRQELAGPLPRPRQLPESPARRPPTRKSRGLPFVGEVLRYLFTGKGMLTYSASLVAASVKVLEESATPDVQMLLRTGSFRTADRRARRQPGMTGGMWQMRPLSRGYVEAKSRRPARGAGDQPALSLATRPTGARSSAACGSSAGCSRRRRSRPISSREILPGERRRRATTNCSTTLRQNGSTVFHATCTCKMGSDPMAVVDDQLRVHGIEGLRVIDASVMPTVTSTNTNAPTIMIAERGAELIRQSARAAATPTARAA